ncbi:MAG: CpaF family protein [Chloroflexi bacterium]|nr:CpaF family protein [Chloroflexota bacterium]
MSLKQRRLSDRVPREAPSREPAPSAESQAAAPAAPPPAAPAPATNSTGDNVPAKNRTPAKLAHLRKLLRPKLLRTPEEADFWDRHDEEKQKILTDRLRAILEKLAQERDEFRVNAQEFEQLRDGLLDDLMGFGAIQQLVDNKKAKEIMVNGPEVIFAETKGLNETEFVFDDEDHLLFTAQRIVRPLGRVLDRANPMVDARLPDGSRVHIVSNPSALNGTTITIRKFPEKPLTVEDLINFGSFTRETSQFLEACIVSALNIVVSGGTGSGKTTLLNVLSSFIPEDNRIVTIEDAAELQLTQRHVVRLETAPPMMGGDGVAGRLTIRDLVKGSLRMRPDRIVVGECRGGEALDMLQAMNTGHDGSLTTVHSNSPRDAVARLETLCLMAGMDLPVSVIRRQIASAVDLIIQQARLKDGARKITQISELQGMEGDSVVLQDIFVYRLPGQTGMHPAEVAGGNLESTGFRPNFIDRLEQNGFRLSSRVFGAGGPNRFGG